MSSRSKALLKQSKSKQKKQQTLDTADDFQAAGVDYEDAAGKWRAGDPVKSMRFFQRAIEVYDQGLQRFPTSLDLAYNKARVQLEIVTHPILVKQLQESVFTALYTALESHRYALRLDQDNADTLFNISQVLTTIAEEIARDNGRSDTEALQYLEEALELQNRCLGLQELKYDDTFGRHGEIKQESDVPTANNDSDDEDGGASLNTSTTAQGEQWFSIVEPVTQDTLIDTIMAQLGTLTTLCGILSNISNATPQATLPWIEEYSSKLLADKLPTYSRDANERLSEIALVKANFVSSLLEAGFRTGKLDLETYKRELNATFSAPGIELNSSSDAILSRARSLLAFNTAIAESRQVDPSTLATARWSALNEAIGSLTALLKLPDVPTEDKAKSHFLRGDASLSQHQMSLPATSYQPAVSNKLQLLKNAEVFYRNASKVSPDTDERAIAGLRSAAAVYLQNGDKTPILSILTSPSGGEAWVKEQLEDMIVEGLIPQDFQLT